MNPWEVLGLPEGCSDEREIRRAYAARVREHPPDVDAEGFRRIREAYESLRDGGAFPAFRDAIENAEIPESGDVAAEEASLDEPVLSERVAREGTKRPEESGASGEAREPGARADAWRAAESRADPLVQEIQAAARRPPGPERDQHLVTLLRKLGDRMANRTELVRIWSTMVVEELDALRRPELAASCARPRDFALDVLESNGEVAEIVARYEREHANFDRLERFARALLERPAGTDSSVAENVVRIARVVAIALPTLASKLCDRAFQEAPDRSRLSELLRETNTLVAAGKEAETWNPIARAHVAKLIDDGDDGDLASRGARAALRKVSELDARSPLRLLLAKRAPRFVISCPRPRRRALRSAASTGSEPFPWRVLFWGLWLVVLLFRRCPGEGYRAPDRWTKEEIRRLEERGRRRLEELRSRRLQEPVRAPPR